MSNKFGCENNRLLPPRHVLIIHPEGNSYNNPSLKCIIDLLKEEKVEIDIRYKKTIAQMPEIEGIRLIPYGKIIALIKKILINHISFLAFIQAYVFIENILFYKKYDVIIGVDREGLIEASLLNKLTNTPYIFISFEIMFESETSFRFKRLERIASQNVSLWIVQDNVRSYHLKAENNLSEERCFLLPVASKGYGVQLPNRLRDKLGIPSQKKVAIAIGSITEWSMITTILETLFEWPDEWVLIIHDRYGRTTEGLSNEINKYHELINNKLFISDLAAHSVDDMGFVLSGVSVGLGFYKPNFRNRFEGNNLRYLGLSSGKISTYLRYGVPIITNEIGVFSEEAKRYEFGLVVEDPAQLSEILDQIDDRKFEINAKKYFTEKLDFNIYRDLLWKAIVSCQVSHDHVS